MRVVIVGAGLSGLSVAFRLKQRGVTDVTVLEPGVVGGNVRTLNVDGFRVEAGPNGFLDGKPSTVQLCRDLGLGDKLLAASDGSRKNRFVYLNDRVHKLPGSPLGIFTTPLLSVAGKVALLREPWRRRPADVPDDESVAAFARRRFGKEAAHVFIDALVTGIHAADPETLSVAAAFPRLVAFEREHGSVLRGFLATAKAKKRAARERGDPPPPPQRMWSFRGGLQEMIDALASHATVHPGVRVRRIERTENRWLVRGDGTDSWPADAVVLTCPAYAQGEMLADLDPPLAEEIAGIAYNRIAVVALGYREPDARPRDGFGYIAPQHTRRDVLGVQWCSSIFPDRAPPGFVLWRALCGGAGRPDVLDWSDDELTTRCHGELRHALGVTGMPAFAQVVRWPRAIPQYTLGHPARVARIEAAVERHPGLHLTGNAYRGIAMNDVTEQAAAVAERIE